MSDEAARWRRVESICEAVLAQPAAQRLVFMRQACGDDDELRRDVEGLVAKASAAARFLEHPAAALAATVMPGESQALTGRRLGAFVVGALLGAGGMGRVYRARDTRLGRDVAIKVLPAHVTDAPDRLARFEREARLLASLNHPNIAAIYGVEEFDLGPAAQGTAKALVLELVEGETLAERLSRGNGAPRGAPHSARPASGASDEGRPLDEALDIARQIALALEAAHERGIVHRDLKPANVKITPAGVAKVLDFGVAKAVDTAVEVQDGSSADLLTVTVPGVLLGTPAYMAPEQAKGLEIDRRVDLWAFGCVLFEMLTGRRAFEGDTLTAVLLAVTTHAPAWDALPATTPAPVRTLLRRCLDKDPRRRIDSAAMARIEIDEVLGSLTAAAVISAPSRTAGGGDGEDLHSPQTSTRRRSTRRVWLATAAAGLALAVVVWLTRPGGLTTNTDVPRLQNAVKVTSSLDVENYPTWSPDGKRLAYQATAGGYLFIADHDIWVTQVDSGEPVNLTKGSAANDRRPSWSPDGGEIAFYSDRDGDWAVYAVPAIGGAPRKLLALPGMDALNWSAPQWSRDGKVLFISARQSGENRVHVLDVPSLASRTVLLPTEGGNVCWDLSVRPDGQRFAYVAASGGATEVTRLWSIGADAGAPFPLTDGRTNVWSPTWSRDGRTIYYISNRGGSMDLWQQSLDDAGRPSGDAVALTRGLGIRSAAFSPDGTKLAYMRGGWVSNVWRAPLPRGRPAEWADAQPVTSEHAYIEAVDVSPDGRFLAVSSDRRGNADLWRLPAEGGEMIPLTTDPAPDWNPRWSRDGNYIAFYSYRSGNRDIWVMPSNGGQARQLSLGAEQDMFQAWSPDGTAIAFRSGQSLSIVPAGGGPPRVLPIRGQPEWAPDGRSLILNQQGRHVRVPTDGGAATPLPATPHPANHFRVSRDGRFLYYSVISGPRENHDYYRLSVEDGTNVRLTRLQGRRGVLGYMFATDDRTLYFTWREDDGDIWVMDHAALATSRR